jgi:phosphoglycolate phosphatase
MVGDGLDRLLARAFAARAAPADAAALPAFVADYAANAAIATRLFPGVADMLGTLADAGWMLAVCTNKLAAPARSVLDSLGILDRFVAIGAADTVPARKPDPSHLLATLAAAGGAPRLAVMLGDHANDVRAARAAGVPAIFAGWGYGPAAMADGAAATARCAAQVPALAKRLLGLG